MELFIREIKNKESWEKFVSECQEKTFLQSWNWGEFQKMMGNKIWRFGVFDEDKLISVTLVVKVKAKRGKFLFVPHGPIIKIFNFQFSIFKKKVLDVLFKKLKEIAKEEKVDFIRIAPILERNEENNKIFRDLGFRQAPIHMHPELTWELNITASEENILMGMRKTSRYLIRQAKKNQDIEITQSQNLKDVEIFNQLYQKTVARHHFIPFSLEYLKNEFLVFKDNNQVSVFLGKYKNEVIASAIIIFHSGIGYYHQGASSVKYPQIPVSYLLQWEAIKEAKRRGCHLYNFWGIAPNIGNWELGIGNLRRHPWAGLTLFKMGFGGYRKEYVKTQDFPLSKKYFLTYIFEKLRKIKRGL